MSVAFVSSRVGAYLAGVRFDGQEWRLFWHFIDPVLLEFQLTQSLLYLHGQPPLFNLLLGLSVKIFGAHHVIVWQATFVLIGLFLTYGLYDLARRLGLSQWPAAMASALFCASPAVLLYESFLFYTYPVVALLLLSVLLLDSALKSGSTGSWALLSWCLAAVVLIRTLFHPLWMLAVLLVLAALLPQRRRKILLAAALPCAVVLMVVAKNALLFDSFGLSSWRGMNLARVTLDRLPKQQRRDWVQSGVLSPVAGVGPFKPLKKYRRVITLPPPRAIPVLDSPRKLSGEINFHHQAYVGIARTLEADSIEVIRRAPGVYAGSVWRNLLQSLRPAGTYKPLKNNRTPLMGYERAFGFVVLRFGQDASPLLITLGVPLVLLAAMGWLWRGRSRLRDREYLVVAYLALTCLYAIGTGALFERTENQRFRFTVDPFLITLALVMLNRLFLGKRTDQPRQSV